MQVFKGKNATKMNKTSTNQKLEGKNKRNPKYNA